MLILLAACRPDPAPYTGPDHPPAPVPSPVPEGDPPEILTGPEVLLPVSLSVRLAQRIVATTDRPTRATLVVDDGTRRREIAFPDLATAHDLPLLALRADTSYSVDVTFTDADGGAITSTVAFETGPIVDEFLPELELVSAVPERAEPGYTLFPAEIGPDANVLAVDAEGRIVGTWATRGGQTRALMFDDGTFTALIGDLVSRWDPLGEVLDVWVASGVLVPYAIVLPIDGVHHEVAFASDGSFWTLHKVPVLVPDYPTTEDDPSVTTETLVDADVAIHLAADGTLLHEWSLLDRLDPNRIGFGSVEPSEIGGGADWGHANAIVPLADGSGILVSLRHQDAIVKLSMPDGELQWILGNPDGWDPEFVPYLLEPVGPLAWPYHQHGPMIDATGRLTLFDNGNDRRTTPYSQSPDPGGLYSRIVQYQIDEAAGTVSQVFESYGTQEPGGGYRLYSQALGNADVLPVTGNILSTFAYLHEEDGVRNQEIGRGDTSVRLIEVDPETGDTVWDLRLYTTDETPKGLLTDRAIRVPSLYGNGVTERWLP